MPALRSKREQWLLALLVLKQHQDTSREWMAATLWPDNHEEQALFYLRKALSNLRKALGAQAARLLSPSPRTIRLEMAGAAADVLGFDQALSQNRFEEAVVLYRGPLMPDCQEDWALLERGQRELAYFDALEQLAKLADPAAAVRWLRLLVAADPYRESAYRALMQALAACGDSAAVTVIYRELQERLFQHLNTHPSAETEELYKQLSQEERPTASIQSAPAEVPETKRHLPVPLSDLIGREAAIAEVLEWMKQRRLVTLVGAGGIGKTRLAIAVAEAALPQYSDGVWFVDLAVLSDSALVPQATAKALGIAEQQQRPVIETLAEELANRSMLVVLDNCEHVAEACADLAFRLLSSSPKVSILATSRQALNVAGEQVYRVPSLELPSVEESDVDGYEAIRLFVDRAYRVADGFRLNQKNAADIAEICRELDGIPLAIEMAAARMRSLSVSEIRSRLGDRFRLLKTGNRGALPRQHTLRATIDWSYDHLSEQERDLLCKVSVFAGGWTLEAAEAVADIQTEDEDVQDLLSSLVDKSLAIAEPQGDKTRYRLLETVKQYANYRLVEGDQELAVRTRHRDYFIQFAIDVRAKLMGVDQAHWFSVLDAEHDNLRQALKLCLDQPDGGEYGLRLSAALSRFWLTRGHFTEGRENYNAITAHPSAQVRTRDRSQALNGAGLLAWRQSDYKAAEAHYHEAISISRELGDGADVGRALNNLALITRDQGDYATARTYHVESIELMKAAGEKLIAAICLSNLGVVSQYQGDFAAARASFEEGLAVQRELGDLSSISVTLHSLGAVALDQCDHEYARLCHDEGLKLAKEIEDRYGCAQHLFGLGVAADQRGDLEEAGPLLRESMVMMHELGERTVVTDFFAAFASLAHKEDRLDRAVRLYAARTNLRGITGSPLQDYVIERMESELASLKGKVGEERFEKEWEAGTTLSLERAIDYALEKTGE
jgi:predicted ATPase/DNA-binding SARP family transcriptional activator